MRRNDRKIYLIAILGVLSVGTGISAPASSQTIMDEWAGIKAPPPPELKPVTIDPKVTGLLTLDFVKQNCGPRPRCVASLPRVQRLLTQAREKGLPVVHSLIARSSVADLFPEVAVRAGEPVVTSGPDKFLNTDLEKILKEKGVTTVIVVGTAAEGAVLHTAAGAALRGFNVILPVDGMSSTSAYPEQYTTVHLASRFAARTTLTRVDLIGY